MIICQVKLDKLWTEKKSCKAMRTPFYRFYLLKNPYLSLGIKHMGWKFVYYITPSTRQWLNFIDVERIKNSSNLRDLNLNLKNWKKERNEFSPISNDSVNLLSSLITTIIVSTIETTPEIWGMGYTYFIDFENNIRSYDRLKEWNMKLGDNLCHLHLKDNKFYWIAEANKNSCPSIFFPSHMLNVFKAFHE